MADAPPFAPPPALDPNSIFFNVLSVIPIEMLQGWLSVLEQIANLSTQPLTSQVQDSITKINTLLAQPGNIYLPSGGIGILGSLVYQIQYNLNTFAIQTSGEGITPINMFQHTLNQVRGCFNNCQISFYNSPPGTPARYGN
jgi:hypothetical protein